MPFGIQPIHLVVIVIVGLVIFGPSRLPELGRGLGRALTEFRKGSQEMAEVFREELGHGPVNDNAPETAVAAPTLAVTTDPTSGPPAGLNGAVSNRCQACQVHNPPASRFCNSCGSPLGITQTQ